MMAATTALKQTASAGPRKKDGGDQNAGAGGGPVFWDRFFKLSRLTHLSE